MVMALLAFGGRGEWTLNPRPGSILERVVARTAIGSHPLKTGSRSVARRRRLERRCGVGLELRKAVFDGARIGARASNAGLDIARIANHPCQNLAQCGLVIGRGAAQYLFGLVRLGIPVANDRLQT